MLLEELCGLVPWFDPVCAGQRHRTMSPNSARTSQLEDGVMSVVLLRSDGGLVGLSLRHADSPGLVPSSKFVRFTKLGERLIT